MGYHNAGFEVVGVDIEAHPDNPFPVIVGDATVLVNDADLIAGFDALHGSPPCQGFTTMSNRWRGKGGKADGHPKLIDWTRAGFVASGLPYVIENVAGARKEMRNPVTLTGGMFGLGVHRPRLFESNFPIAVPPRAKVVNPVGVYGKQHDGRRLFTRKDGTIQRAAASLEEGQRAMCIDWMQWHDLTESIPPAYTEFIGRQLLAAIEVAA